MKLSIITSFYNCGRYAEELAKSILEQSHDNWEWIVCDDFSTDDTRKFVEQLPLLDNRIRLVEPRFKKEIWWNPQIHATGEIVCPIDGDDIILPGTFERVVKYFEYFPGVVLMHFNANKYQNELPKNENEIFSGFVDNVYMSRDNDSFLEGFQRLCPERTGIFGYLRIFRNIPGLNFKVHDDSGDCSSNDGQWLLTLEEMGKWITIPRTTYVARQHYDSENFRNWNIRGEVKLIEEAVERRRGMDLPMPRKNDIFDDVYEAAESTYLSALNWEKRKCTVGFLNFHYSDEQMDKLRALFFEHDILSEPDEDLDYVFIRINPFDKADFFSRLMSANSFRGKVCLFCDNIHLQNNNRTGSNNLESIKEAIVSFGPAFFLYQNNRAYFIMNRVADKWNNQANQQTETSPKNAKMENIDFKSTLIDGYENTQISITEKRKRNTNIEFNYFEKPRVDVKCEEGVKVKVKFIREKDNSLLYETELGNNMFGLINRTYHEDFRIEAFDGTELKVLRPDFRGKRVYIHLDSSSLGDTIAWFPYVEEFRKKNRCTVICSTFHNELFEKEYPEIEFVKPGQTVHNLYKMFTLGWFYNEKGEINSERNPSNFRDQNLQKTACDILGLDFEEIRPKMSFEADKRPVSEKYVCMANHSTAQSKYWNNPDGWQKVVDFIKSKGYRVLLLSREPDGYMGNQNPKGVEKISDKSLKEIMNYLWHCEFFIGLGSGLSWVSWALGKRTILISGFSRPNCEMTSCERVFVRDTNAICNGCFNDFRLDPSDWNWCPRHKGTIRQFECTKSITGEHVIERIKDFFQNENPFMHDGFASNDFLSQTRFS